MEHKMSLYEIDAAIMNLVESCIDEETGEITVDPAKLEALEMKKIEKISNICRYSRNLNAQIDACKAEAVRFSSRASQLSNVKDSLKKLLTAVIPEGEKVIDTTTGDTLVSWRKSEAVVIENEDKVMFAAPDCIVVTESISKSKLKAKLKTIGIDGARLEVRQNIQVK